MEGGREWDRERGWGEGLKGRGGEGNRGGKR